MKLILFTFLIFFQLHSFIDYTEHHFSNINESFLDDKKKEKNSSDAENQQRVYICTGKYAYAYHSRPDCPGLNNCKGEIKYTNEYTAINQLERMPCCRCWSNVEGRCKDDNPYNQSTTTFNPYVPQGKSNNSTSSGYAPDVLAYAALAIIGTAPIILSNDFYIYPVYSFNNGFNKNNITYYDGKGIAGGFRKTFKHSALEYGISYMLFNTVTNYYQNYSSGSKNILGIHLNYVHQLFYNSTPYWLKFYLGPTVNYIYKDYGYGGIVGTEMKLLDRLKFDVRYEWTTQTNQIMAGLIITFQKKYFWQK